MYYITYAHMYIHMYMATYPSIHIHLSIVIFCFRKEYIITIIIIIIIIDIKTNNMYIAMCIGSYFLVYQ